MGHNNFTKEQIRYLYVEREMNAEQIAEGFNNSPTARTINRWSLEMNTAGKTWRDYRDARVKHHRYSLIPWEVAEKIYLKLRFIAQKPEENFTTKDAEAIVKLEKLLIENTEGNHLRPVVYTVLLHFMQWIMKHHREIITSELSAVFQEYKNVVQDNWPTI